MDIFQEFLFKTFIFSLILPVFFYFIPRGNERIKDLTYTGFYGFVLVFSLYYVVCLMNYKELFFNSFTFIKNINLTFSPESYGIIFLIAISIVAMIITKMVYDYFIEVDDEDGYDYYSKIGGIIFSLVFLSSFLNNIVMLIIFSYLVFFVSSMALSHFYIKEKLANNTFLVCNSIAFILIITILSYIYNTSGIELEFLSIKSRINSISVNNAPLTVYLIVLSMFASFLLPIQFVLSKIQAREISAIIFGIIIFGFFLNYFVAIKLLYYFFSDDLLNVLFNNEIKYFAILCILINFYFIFKNIHNAVNSIFFFLVNSFLCLILFLFFVQGINEFYILFSHYILFIFAVLSVFASLNSSIVLLFNLNEEDFISLYSKSKTEVLLLFVSLGLVFLVILSLLISNIKYLINFNVNTDATFTLLFIFLFMIISIVTLFISLKNTFIEIESYDDSKIKEYIQEKQFNILLSPIISISIFIVLFLFKGMIVMFLNKTL